MSLTIGKKLRLGFISMLLITVALGFFSYFLLFNVSDNTSQLSEHNLPVVRVATSLERKALEMLLSERVALASSREEDQEKTLAHLKELNTLLDSVDALASKINDNALDKAAKEIRDIVKDYSGRHAEAVKALRQNKALSKVMDERGNQVVKDADDFMSRKKSRYVEAKDDLEAANGINAIVFETLLNEKNLAIYKVSQYHDAFKESLGRLKEGIGKLDKPGIGEEEKALVDQFRQAFEYYSPYAEELTAKIVNLSSGESMDIVLLETVRRGGDGVVSAASDYLTFKRTQVDKIAQALFTVSSLYKEVLSARVKEKLYMLTKEKPYWEELTGHLSTLGELTKTQIELAAVDGSRPEEIEKIKNAQNAVQEYLTTATAWLENDKRVYGDILPAMSKGGESVLSTVRETEESGWKDAEYVRTDTLEVAGNGMRMVVIALFVAAVVGGLLAVLMVRSITGPLKRVIDGLLGSAGQVASASSHFSSSSQSLSDGASRQAAVIEELSSSIEEISSMTRRNAQNAQLADSSMLETTGFVEEVRGAMKALTDSMKDMSQSSREIQKIIKTIDEIAFQTNLLALNAAVEAARAGEAGAGFAVVAGEVRNLAMRAAEASKHTADLIEGTVKKVNTGSSVVDEAEKSFEKVVIGARKAGQLVKEIAMASNEQSQGIEQVGKAIADMSTVTQENAAGAEESASASEELNEQSEQMKNFVKEMTAMVGGNFRALPANDYPERRLIGGHLAHHGQIPSKTGPGREDF